MKPLKKKYSCGCPIGTLSIYYDQAGNKVPAGSIQAYRVVCTGCGHTTSRIVVRKWNDEARA